MLILDMPMPRACDDCPMLDESGDYPMCRITQETRGYSFNVREKRMDRCPIKGGIIQCNECTRQGTLNCLGFKLLQPSSSICADGGRKDDEQIR